MEDSPSQPVEGGHHSVKLEEDPMYSFSPESKAEDGCEAMDTNNNNNATPEDNYEQERNEQENDPFSKPDLAIRARQTNQASKLGSSQAGLISPEFRSRTETPVSSSQLLNIPSSALFALEGIDFNTPIGSSLISPLASARMGRKRQLSISPLSSSSIDLNSLIRTSPTSLVNYITNSRSSSAGSIGHLSPSFFSKTNRLQTPHTRPLQVSLRNSGYPLPPALNQLDSTLENPEDLQVDIKQEPSDQVQLGDCIRDVKMEQGMGVMLRDTGNHMASNLETVCEEPSGDIYSSEDEANTAQQEEIDSKKGITDEKNKRVYYNYPSVEDPHNNQCRWDDCSHQCDTLEALVHHVNSEHIYHDSRKEFVCYWNGCVREKKPFKAQYMLLVHMRRHTGEKPHKCTYDGCNKAYSRLENLKTHLRSHTGERPYLCKVEGCTKAFSNASDCAKHMNRTHTDEKPYACPNPGCTKRYTDPSSRRKHVKNCQVNKRARTGDPESAQPEEVTSPEQKSAAVKKGPKARKPEKRKASGPPSASANQFPSLVPQANGGPSLTDHGYFSGSSQGYTSSQLSYNSLPESESDYAKLRGDEEISHILQQQRLSDPHDNATQSNFGRPLNRHFQIDRHVSEHVDPNVRASRQNGGELTLPAGTIHPTPPTSHFPHIHSPSYPSSHSKYSQFHNPRHSHQSNNNPRMSRTNSLSSPQINPYGRRVPSTNGPSMYRPFSPSGAPGPRKSPSDDGSIASGGLQSSNMTNSYSTFSSNSSRVSSPCSNSGSGRGDVHTQNGYSTQHFRAHYPLRQHLKMISSYGPREYHRRQSSDTFSEHSWKSSQSSRYSFTSELSDDVLENLPASERKNSFSRVPPLPLPDSMQNGMDFDNSYIEVFSSQQMPNSDPSAYSQMNSDHLGQPNSDPLATLPLYHIGGGNAMEVTAEVNGFSAMNGGLFSQEAPSDEHDFIFNDLPYTASTNNMMIGDMSSFAGALSEDTHYFEQLVHPKKAT